MSSKCDVLCCDKLSIFYYPHFLSSNEASVCYTALYNTIHWQEEWYQMFGKRVLAPRLVAWYGDQQAVYPYSGVIHHPHAWNNTLVALKKKVELFSGKPVNSVLLNLYRSGQDSMGWHADNETELGNEPVIISISLGGQRTFHLKDCRTQRKISLSLGHGSMLIMEGQTQNYFKHALPKTKKSIDPRINLTFRLIQSNI